MLIMDMLAFILYIGSCGGSSSGSSRAKQTISVHGQVQAGSGYIAYAPAGNLLDKFCSLFTPSLVFAPVSDVSVNQVIAIQIDHGYIGSYFIQTAKEAAFKDGKFTLSLETDKDWILLLVDTNAISDTQKFVGYVAYRVDSGNSLLALPASSATVSDIDLGNIDKSGDEALSTNPVTATEFAMTAEGLLTLAKNDNIFRAVKNIYTNYKNGVYYNIRPDFTWHGDYASIENDYQAVTAYNYFSHSFQLDSNDGITMDAVAGLNGTPKKLLQLYPPTGTSVPTRNGIITYTDITPLSNANLGSVTTGGNGLRIVAATTPGEFCACETTSGNTSYVYGSGCLTGTIPANYWTYKIDGVTKGEFDCAVSTPLTDDYKINGFVPVLKVNVEATITKTITSVDVKWYALSGTDYAKITDSAILNHLIKSTVFISDQAGTRYDSINLDSTMSHGTPAMEWYFGTAGTADKQAAAFGIFYQTGGVGYTFNWFRP
jgi:hypothetical protein